MWSARDAQVVRVQRLVDDARVGDADGQRHPGEAAVALAQVVADDAVDDEGPVDRAGRGEDLAAIADGGRLERTTEQTRRRVRR